MATSNNLFNTTATTSHFLENLDILLQIIYLPVIGILFGSLLISLILSVLSQLRNNNDYKKLSRDIFVPPFSSPLFWLFSLLLPFLAHNFIVFQLYSRTDFVALPYAGLSSLFMLLSFIFLYLYVIINPRTLPVNLSGLSALLLMALAIYVNTALEAMLTDPEKWLFSQNFHKVLLTWNGVTDFICKFLLMLSFTGIWLGLNSKKWYEYAFLQSFIPLFTIGTILPQPIIMLWHLLFVPDIAIQQINMIFIAFNFFLLGFATFSVVKVMESGESRHFRGSMFILLLVIVVSVFNSRLEKVNALRSQVLNLRGMIKISSEKKETVTVGKSKGEDVYKRVCSVCHDFDNKKVGPAFNQVIPKYKNREELKAFIKNPVKKNPEFPPMPPPPITDEEMDAVSEYLMERVKN